jgi:ABC-2 type transport system permease protein
MSETIAVPTPLPGARPRAAISTAYLTLLRWQLAKLGPILPLVVIVQVLMAAGLVIGFGFLIPDITPAAALFLSTGVPTVLLLTIGFVLVPNMVSQARLDGTFAYQRALPVPRPLLLLADLTVWSLVALPGIAVAMVIAWLRYDLALAVNWPLLVATAVTITVTATAVGYMIAVALPPALSQLVSQALVFFVLLFSPVSFPTGQLPGWFQAVHDVLPIRPAADLLRAALASGTFEVRGRDLAVLLAWCVVGVLVSVRALVRRV